MIKIKQNPHKTRLSLHKIKKRLDKINLKTSKRNKS